MDYVLFYDVFRYPICRGILCCVPDGKFLLGVVFSYLLLFYFTVILISYFCFEFCKLCIV